MQTSTKRRWRLLFIAAGIATVAGGRLHPESDAEQSLRQELATMTSGDSWVLSHSLLAFGTALLALGLWVAHRDRSWPRSTHRALGVCAAVMSLYFVETIFHLASVVDSDALARGDAAPVAFTHVGLAAVLYPLTGLVVAWLSVTLLAAVDLPRKTFAIAGLAGGLLHATSVPLTLVFPDTEFTPVFASAALLFAVWAFGTGASGLTRSVPTGRHDMAHGAGVEPAPAEMLVQA